MRRWLLLLLSCALLPGILTAQRSSRSSPACWRARPQERCRVIILTNFGGYVQSRAAQGETHFRAMTDWGALAHVGPRDAVGVSFFASLDADAFVLGPAVRYRRWIGPDQSVDIALGTPVLSSDYGATLSAYGLVKWNPVHWVGIALRPEVRRPVTTCDQTGCRAGSRFVGSAGVEFGWVPGLSLTFAAGAVGLVAAIALAGID